MDDDELIDRLRHTLRAEAEALTPSPEDYPTARYRAPARLHPVRARWPLALAAAAVAAGVVLAAVNWPGGGRPSRIGLVSPGPQATTVPTVAPSTVTTAPTTVPTVTTAAPAITVPVVAPPVAVPAGFSPASVTFVSPDDGWVAGTVSCASGSCLAMARTHDAGLTWTTAPAPAAPIGGIGPGHRLSVRFADPSDGWIYTDSPSRLWSTHDGGAHWTSVDLPLFGSSSTIMAMEAAGGMVDVAVLDIPAAVRIESSPVTTDAWTANPTTWPIGAGPVPSTQLVLQKDSGWVLQVDRTVVGGARLGAGGQWSAWTPPCTNANGAAELAASTPADLIAVCQEGDWGPAGNLPAGAATPSDWLFRSGDGGATFQPVGPLPAADNPSEVTSTPSAETIVAAGGSGSAQYVNELFGSFDGGKTWSAVYTGPRANGWADLGFTTDTQGVAIEWSPAGSALLMTRDGGHSWSAVNFRGG